MKKDYSELLPEIKAELNRCGQNDLALQIDEAVSRGSTGTEIMMLVGGTLRGMKEQAQLNEKTKSLVCETLSRIDKWLAS